MKTRLSSKGHYYLTRISMFLVLVTLIAVMVGCASDADSHSAPAVVPARYILSISSTEGGSVSTPGEGTFTYDEGEVINLVAEPQEGYYFVKWTGSVDIVGNVNAAETTVTMAGHCSITANFGVPICDWSDLDAIRNNLSGDYVLINDLDSATDGYTELVSPTANEGQGWRPIGTFTGSFDGQGYEIRDLFLDRPAENEVGLFGCVSEGTVINNLGVVNGDVSGHESVGGLVGENWGTISNSYYTGNVTGQSRVGGLTGWNERGTVSSCYSIGNITGGWDVGGVVGGNYHGIVSNSYSTDTVTGDSTVGGLVGWNHVGTVHNSYFTGGVTGHDNVGGLLGRNEWNGTVSNSYYSYDDVLINEKNTITIGALFNQDFEKWLANGKFLDVNERLSREDGYYIIEDTSDFKQLLAFGQDDSLRFRLRSDLDLATEPDLYIPYFAGVFDGDGHKIRNLSFNSDFVTNVGLFGYLASGGTVNQVGAENINITGHSCVGALTGSKEGTVAISYATGSVTGWEWVGGLVGSSTDGTLRDSYFAGSVTSHSGVGGLVGQHMKGIVRNSYYNYGEVLINGRNVITIGALSAEDFDRWLANGRLLDINERLSQEDGYYIIEDVTDFKQLLAFGQDNSLRFRLENDLDLASEPNFYIPYLAGVFDGNGHKILNLSFGCDALSHVGLFGYLYDGAKVSELGVEDSTISADAAVGGLVGWNGLGTVSNSYCIGSITGGGDVGGLVGISHGTVSKSYADGSVTGGGSVGGLVGRNWGGTVSDSYSASSVTGHDEVGGLVGWNKGTVRSSYSRGRVTGVNYVGGLVGFGESGGWEGGGGFCSESFWDLEASGIDHSEGGTGKTTADMQDIATFSGTVWNIIVVNSGETNPAYTWNIVDGQSYPFLSWQFIS